MYYINRHFPYQNYDRSLLTYLLMIKKIYPLLQYVIKEYCTAAFHSESPRNTAILPIYRYCSPAGRYRTHHRSSDSINLRRTGPQSADARESLRIIVIAERGSVCCGAWCIIVSMFGNHILG